jgi:ubiquinone/menaquinone biosynthesis methyltransferase
MDIYNVDFVEQLFDEMAGTYERVNTISSFGFSRRWRKQFVRQVAIRPNMVVYDLMCGMGECWGAVTSLLSENGRIIALDLSTVMLRGAEREKEKFPHLDIVLFKENILTNSLETASADCIISGFGVKTFSDEQKEILATEIHRILKPGGLFSLVEISVPHGRLLKALYMFYLKQVIPVVGRLFLGNPENYRMLGIYTERFHNCRNLNTILARHGLQTNYHDYFFGCASGVSGSKR